jgi:hypothetical protein
MMMMMMLYISEFIYITVTGILLKQLVGRQKHSAAEI